LNKKLNKSLKLIYKLIQRIERIDLISNREIPQICISLTGSDGAATAASRSLLDDEEEAQGDF
jgi:hypothetical protein